MVGYSSDDDDAEFMPAVLQRPKVANYVVHESFTVDTRDHEDHTFCGVMFDICCRDTVDGGVPLEFLQVDALSVRGVLGPLTVWTTPHTFRRSEHSEEDWELIYEQTHRPSLREFVKLEFKRPIRLAPGESRGIYVHSKQPGDDAIVYDNQRSRYTYEDDVFRVLPGLAHLSNRPFGRQGMWGFPWRENREFVGQFYYGVKYTLWNPEIHRIFPSDFKEMVKLLLLCARRPSSPLHAMQDEVLYYILNMCKHDWFRQRNAVKPVSAPPQGGGCGYSGYRSLQNLSMQGAFFPTRPLMMPGALQASASHSETSSSYNTNWDVGGDVDMGGSISSTSSDFDADSN